MSNDGTDDENLWDYVTKSVAALPAKHKNTPAKDGDKYDSTQTAAAAKKRKNKKKYTAPTERALPAAPQEKALSKEIDRRTNEKLRRGQMEIESQLDLHGMNQEQARHALEHFIESAHRQSLRCVLVITGKGKRGTPNADEHFLTPGVLRQNVPLWLSEGRLNDIVLQSHTAKAQDGGEGALYVLLRRRRP